MKKAGKHPLLVLRKQTAQPAYALIIALGVGVGGKYFPFTFGANRLARNYKIFFLFFLTNTALFQNNHLKKIIRAFYQYIHFFRFC